MRGWVWHPLTTCRLTLKPGAVAAISRAVAAGSWAVAAGSGAVAAGSWVVAAGSWVLAAGSCPVAAAAGLGWAAQPNIAARWPAVARALALGSFLYY